jgi:hypothetical protein
MAKIRPARRCRARSKRTGGPCRAYAVTGAVVCRMHGASAGRVRVAAAQRRERESFERAMVYAEQRHAERIEAWIAERIEVTAELLDMPAEQVGPEDAAPWWSGADERSEAARRRRAAGVRLAGPADTRPHPVGTRRAPADS